jgi:hypothetical protein
MQWEIVLAIFLIIGIYTAIREAGEKLAARKREAGKVASENHSPEESFRTNNK